ncbi:RHS repeat-associated core domain-containing protein, partial [Pectobacterium versatile]
SGISAATPGGQYISPDPIGVLGGDDNYGYVPNPNTWVDPFGLSIEWVHPSSLSYSQAYISDNVSVYIKDMASGNWD